MTKRGVVWRASQNTPEDVDESVIVEALCRQVSKLRQTKSSSKKIVHRSTANCREKFCTDKTNTRKRQHGTTEFFA